MKIKKILIIPAPQLVPFRESFLRRFARFTRRGFKIPLPNPYSAEIQMYGDIPKVLGKEQTFILGEYKPYLLSKDIPPQCPFPSCYGAPEGNFVSHKELDNTLRKVDAMLISIQLGKHIIEPIIKKARANNIPIAMIDFNDHETLYGVSNEEKRKKMFRGFIPGKHFDLFFKKDLCLGYKTDKVLPLAPVPVRPESYNFEVVPKDKTISFSGKLRPTLYQGDRVETADLVKNNFPNVIISEFESEDIYTSLEVYWRSISSSQMALSPSGRVWDSFRHCEIGLAPLTCLIAPKPFVETVDPYLVDGKNAILYDTELREDGKYHLVNSQTLVEKIRYYLSHPVERENIARAWQTDVLKGHTIFARSKYIIENMEKVFSLK